MAICEDFPCCGHTDGLGCDWVSPNEIVPCDLCIEARRDRPYHEGQPDSCPTRREAMRKDAEGHFCANTDSIDHDEDQEPASVFAYGAWWCYACAEPDPNDMPGGAFYDEYAN